MRTYYQNNKGILPGFFFIAISFYSTLILAQTNHIEFDAQYYKAHLKFLADDLLEGRKPGTKGGDLAALYIAKQFESIGLKPISDKQEYFQMVPAIGFSTDYQSVQFTIKANKKKEMLKPFDEVVLLSQEPTGSIKIKGDLVFVGYGIEAPEYDWNDFKNQDVSGKILVVLFNDPDYKKTGFGSESWTYYSMWTYKEEMAILKGAKGIIYLHNDEMATFPFSVIQHSITPEWSYPESRTKNPLRLYACVSQPAFERVLSIVGLNFNMLKEQAESKDFSPMPLKLNAEISFNQNYRRFRSPNVIGILPGTEIDDECIIYMAHYDHLGVGEPIKGDSIYNGARDNASGTAALISLAHEFSTRPTKRSIVFLATTGEESNFLGSEYYVMNPIIPLNKTIIGFNMDMMSFYGRREMFGLYPIECSDAVQRVKSLGQELDLELMPDGIDKNGLFFRCDHFPFNARHVATFTIGLGGKYLTMSKDEIAEIRKQVGQFYHQPNDEVYSWFRYDGVLQELKVLYHMGSFYANQGEKPNFKPENPYNAAKRIIKMKQGKGIY